MLQVHAISHVSRAKYLAALDVAGRPQARVTTIYMYPIYHTLILFRTTFVAAFDHDFSPESEVNLFQTVARPVQRLSTFAS